jgi:hypothetical protein
MVCLYYRAPEDNVSDESMQTDQIQGFSLSVCFDANCIECLGTFSIAGTILEAVGAEFIEVHCMNGRDDTDPLGPRPGELIVGILVDAAPPFDQQELPPTLDFLKLLCVDFRPVDDIDCETCNMTPITFCDGGVGAGEVPTNNIVSIMNMPFTPGVLNGVAMINLDANFTRGDCNGKQDGVDISDAAAIISFLFYTSTWKFIPPCEDACDANDDGRVDLADSVYLLRYLFRFDREPLSPFPEPGTDPTFDKLTCVDGATSCP